MSGSPVTPGAEPVLDEAAALDGAPVARDGAITPDLSRAGIGLTFKRQDAEQFKA